MPSEYDQLFQDAGKQSYFHSKPWFKNFINTAIDPGDEPRIYGAKVDNEDITPNCVLMMRSSNNDASFGKARVLTSLSNFYSMEFSPHVRRGSGIQTEETITIVKAIVDESPRWDIIRFSPMLKDSPNYNSFMRALKVSKLFIEPYFQFGNWYETIEVPNFDAYLKNRPSKLKNTYKRKSRSLAKSGRAKYRLYSTADNIDAGIIAYTAIYNSSWKEPEQYPAFIPSLIRSSARAGGLRLGILFVDDEPAAAQIWMVGGKRATIYKLAYDERFKSLSVGTILGMELAKHVIETDRVNEIDYGSGDDPYKKDWMSSRREFWGLLGYNPRTWRGKLGISRVMAKRAIRIVQKPV